MKPRIPYFINIIFTLSLVIITLFIFTNGKFFYNPITISIFIIIIILLLILETLNSIIYNQKLKFLSEKERSILIKKNSENYFIRLYKTGFCNPSNEDKIEKIDHGFDGIIEMDNEIPKWWIYIFYLTIIISINYISAYFITDFAHPYKEYELAYNKQLSEITSYEKIRPQATIKTAIFKKELINEGKKLFDENCATCHNYDGSGNIGPNLTDDYWINKEKDDLFKNIFYILWNGSKNNPTMRAFGALGEIKGNDLEKIASYVYFINKNAKTPQNGKLPEGKKIIWNK
ncbi:MAG: c-type cytochrome [Candidatus Bostrichicola ureolyticus]|nr:MAG: c-type cytochrome [Candidatus Bostrichicola ureolyticus]